MIISGIERYRRDLFAIINLLKAERKGEDHRTRINNFYNDQAKHYDHFRKELLKGRSELLQELDYMTPPNGCWWDLGAGTGYNLELTPNLSKFQVITLVDICEPLLKIAEKRIAQLKATQNSCTYNILRHDLSLSCPAQFHGTADLVTFSYSLTMIPEWYRAVDFAQKLLKPGGTIGIVDFYVSREQPTSGKRHSFMTRRGWPIWFGIDGVELSQDHLQYMKWKFREIKLKEELVKVPYLPLVRVPIYSFIGRKKESSD